MPEYDITFLLLLCRLFLSSSDNLKSADSLKRLGNREKDDGVDWPHNQILNDTWSDQHKESFSVKNRQAKRIQYHIANQHDDKLCHQHTPNCNRLLIVHNAIQKTCQYGYQRKRQKECAGWLYHEF